MATVYCSRQPPTGAKTAGSLLQGASTHQFREWGRERGMGRRPRFGEQPARGETQGLSQHCSAYLVILTAVVCVLIRANAIMQLPVAHSPLPPAGKGCNNCSQFSLFQIQGVDVQQVVLSHCPMYIPQPHTTMSWVCALDEQTTGGRNPHRWQLQKVTVT
jgi:hypothetical protein